MTGRTRWRWGALVIGVMCVIGGGTVDAGSPPPPTIDDEALEAIRALIPEGDPGEYDLDEADMLFGQLVELTELSTDVDDFGTGSEVTGPCGGFAFSFDQDGRRIDAAFDTGDDGPPIDLLDGDQAFTSANPFRVDTRGVVVYFGFMPRSGDGPMVHGEGPRRVPRQRADRPCRAGRTRPAGRWPVRHPVQCPTGTDLEGVT